MSATQRAATGRPSTAAADAVLRRAGAADGSAIERLLGAAGLPLAGLDDLWVTFVAETAGRVVAVAALERHGPDQAPVFLLRSVAVDAAHRNSGLGRAVVTAVLEHADALVAGQGLGSGAVVGLLTETADGYFDRFGFAAVERSDLPAALAVSAELAGACPASARAYLRR